MDVQTAPLIVLAVTSLLLVIGMIALAGSMDSRRRITLERALLALAAIVVVLWIWRGVTAALTHDWLWAFVSLSMLGLGASQILRLSRKAARPDGTRT